MSKSWLGWAVAAGAVAFSCGPTSLSSHGHAHPKSPPGGVPACRTVEKKVVDLTHRMHDDMTFWPGGVGFKKTRLTDYEDGYRLHKFEMGENTGTHVDAPGHFVEGKRAIDEIPVNELVVPVVVLNVRQKAENDPDYQVSGADIVDWEAINGTVPPGAVFVANTGWHGRFDDTDKYINLDDKGVMHFPGFSKAAAQLLVERDVTGIGIDTLSIDPGNAPDFEAHKVMLAANKYQIENLANLDELPETGATLMIGVLPVSEGSQAQARVLALVPDVAEEEEEEE